jgi:NAD(P)H-hydrate epimerase
MDAKAIIIDALFGSGLNRPLSGLPALVTEHINASGNAVISVDIPSGLFAEKPATGPVVRAHRVYTFQFPKLAFLLPDYAEFTGRWTVIDIGLLPQAILAAETDHFYTMKADVEHIFHSRATFSHKGSFGHALLLAGSEGKAGAAVLAGRAALRSGLGLLTMHIPASLLEIIQTAVPEAMCSLDAQARFLSLCPDLKPFSAIGIGPGIGQASETAACFSRLIQTAKEPLVIDADGLNILATEQTLWAHLPKGSILTPHPGEFRRLAGQWSNDYHKIELQKALSKKFGIILVLKGAYTCISDPDGRLFFNSTGNSGMATAGSGDTLTGILTGLMAQGYASLDAAILGVYLHGLAGDLALKDQSESSMIASDIIEHLGQAFKQIEK